MIEKVLLVVVVGAVLACVSATEFTPKIASPQSISVTANVTHGTANGVLYSIVADGYSDGPFLLADLHGANHYDVGYAYGLLLAKASAENYHALLNKLLGSNQLLLDVFELFLDWQYKFVAKGLPQDYLDELKGVADGATVAGYPMVGTYATRTLAVAGIATGDVLHDIEYLLLDELKAALHPKKLDLGGLTPKEVAHMIASAFTPLGRTCSMWGAWGYRTTDGELWSGRNLDWQADTGLSANKVISVYHLPGRHSYASVAFAPLIGSITGMSSGGLTVHEAGDDSTLETLEGYAWSLRLRHVMENASTIAEAKGIWEATKNTLGLNHGIGSANDKKFLALETNANMTAYFFDNDPREKAFNINGTQYGFPVQNAVYRTNHGVSPKFLANAVGGPVPGKDSFTRYMLLHDTFVLYNETNTVIDEVQGVNLTAVVGDKGSDSVARFVSCEGASGGANVVSASFLPAKGIMYLAFENGHGDNHVPACCNNYIKLDMNQWF